MTDKFAFTKVAAPVKVGTRFVQHFNRGYRDERGQQEETFDCLCEVTEVHPTRFDYTIIGEPTNVVNPYALFAKPLGGGVMNFAFNRDLGTRFILED